MTHSGDAENANERVQALLHRVGVCMHGANQLEAATVCARMLVVSIVQMPHSYAEKMKLLTQLIKAMRQDLKTTLQGRHETAKH